MVKDKYVWIWMLYTTYMVSSKKVIRNKFQLKGVFQLEKPG